MDDYRPVPSSSTALVSSLTSLAISNPKAIQGYIHPYSSQPRPNPAFERRRVGRDNDGDDQQQQQELADGLAKAHLDEGRDRLITSWKMTEHFYRRRDCPFPVNARGLFTIKEEQERDRKGKSRIVARGYDKFFSIGEVDWTKWEALQRHTSPPYTLTFKSNGCLILISAISPTECLVSSKHSLPAGPLPPLGGGDRPTQLAKLKRYLGKAPNENLDHATMGAFWLRWTLERAGKTEADLAGELWNANVTAVAELCDDTFEEHVLKISERLTGLHLHGLNRNEPGFFTLPPSEVNAWADRWGFIAMPFLTFDSLDDVRRYTDQVAKDGTWQGEEVEGFVIRSVAKPDATADDRPPYAPGHSFFWKVKFDEPYLTYRQYREITRHLLSRARKQPDGMFRFGNTDPLAEIPSKLKKPEFIAYGRWCRDQILERPELFEDYDRGVVRVREAFLQWYTPERQAIKTRKVKTMIIPVAVPGCGKTLLGVALARLFGFAHTQSDDVTTKKTAAGFLKNIQSLLKKHDVVYCDRNNHLDKHHEELAKLADSISNDELEVRTIALVWDIDSHGFNKALRITSERVLGRGENHQSLRVDPLDQMRHEIVIKNFMSEFAPPEGGRFDETIKMKLEATLDDNLLTAALSIADLLRIEPPSAEAINEALAAALGYKPEVKKELQGRATPEPRYFALAVEIDLAQTVRRALDRATDADPSGRAFLQQLLTDSRITAKPHVTIVHEKSVEGEGNPQGPQATLWNTCQQLRHLLVPTHFSFALTALLWNDRVMTLVVEDIKPQHDTQTASDDVARIETALCEELKDVLHVTVGTAEHSIAPFEARGLVEAWRQQGGHPTEGLHCVRIDGERSMGRVMGLS